MPLKVPSPLGARCCLCTGNGTMARMACGEPGVVFLNNLAAGKAGMIYGEGFVCPQLCPGRAQGSWQALLELFTVPSCCVLLVHPQLQTSLPCFFHLSLSPFPQTSHSKKWNGFPQVCRDTHPLPCVPHSLEPAWTPKAAPLPPCLCPPLPPVPGPLPGAAAAPWHRWRAAHGSKSSMKPQRSQPIPSSPAGTLHSLYTSQAVLPLWLQGCSPSLSFLWAVTSTSVKHLCLSKGEIWGSHFLSKHSC